MNPLVPYLWVAGVIHLAIVAMNVPLPRILRYREQLAQVSPIIRQVFIVHSIYIVLVLLGFSALCFWFAPQLAGETPLGAFLSGCLAVFWGLRLAIQLFYYDEALKRAHRVVHVVFSLAIAYLTSIFLIAALRIVR